MRFHRLVVILVLAFCLACEGRENRGTGHADYATPWVETGDLPALADRGALRILVHRSADAYLPRAGYPFDIERAMAERFARDRGLEPIIVAVDDYGGLIPALLAGRGDVIAANMTVTADRAKQVAFTVGLAQSQEVVVGRADGPEAEDLDGLDGYSIGIMQDTAFWDLAEEKLADRDAVEWFELSATLTSDEVLDGLARKDYDFAIQDSNVLDVVENYREDLQRQFPLGALRPLAWAVRPDNTELHSSLNRFLTRERLTRSEIEQHRDDLAGIRERRVLRVITRNNAASYYLYRGELVGFEYELAQRFADSLDVRLQMVVAEDHEDMIPMLKDGRGDMIAAFMTRSPEREARGIRFSRPYHYATETVVGRAGEAPLDSAEALDGRRLHLRQGSSYWQTAERLRGQGVDVALEAAPSDMETEEIIARVADGDFDLTIADSHILQSEMTVREDIDALLALGDPVSHGWAVREENPALLAAVNSFWNAEHRGLHYNIFYRRYFEDSSRMRAHRAGRVSAMDGGQLSPWDDLTREYAARYDFDWRLILAQMYQESRFDPDAVSWVGARGLMQVMPRTGRELGLSPLDDPEVSIHAGVRYMDWLGERFPDRLPVDERMWFSLAAYNAGIGHVRDARALAARQGRDPDQWFGHVEEAMLLLSQPRYHQQARHGFVRGREPYNYVRHIRDRYRAYVSMTDDE
jgi:membrane-bound lytic murein transglycosylase F